MEKNAKRRKDPVSEDDKLDEALADTFPASDPPSQTDPNKRVGRTKTAPLAGKPRKKS